jgi:hypothetical protein
MRAVVKALAILIFGALVLSPAIAMLELDPLPGDIAFQMGDSHIIIPVAYSLCASAGLALLTYFLKR